jgi:hypothetical protein
LVFPDNNEDFRREYLNFHPAAIKMGRKEPCGERVAAAPSIEVFELFRQSRLGR